MILPTVSMLAAAQTLAASISATATPLSPAPASRKNGLRRVAEGANSTDCNQHSVDFILVEGDSLRGSIEGEIVDMLARFGVDVTTRKLTKEEFNAAEQAGDFHLSFSESWGAPYDPHAYAKGWVAGDEGHFQALAGLEPPNTRDSLFAQIDDVLQEEDRNERADKWEAIFKVVHDNAVMLPLWGARVPTVLNNKRLTKFQPGNQQFDYPVHLMRVLSGEKTVTIAPSGQTGMFQSVGRLDPHTYRPNEFFANNWVYEGLVSYGAYGQVLPALAEGWTVTDKNEGQEYVFELRPDVKFHDGAKWDCAAAKLNFDHVLAGPLRGPDWHGWYGLMDQIDSWECDAEGNFVVTTKGKYYPFLQELSFIRPLRMLSPSAFAGNADPYASNSCHVGWGTVTGVDGGPDVVCAGVTDISGTGPFSFTSRTSVELSDGATVDEDVVFTANPDYWDGAPDIETLVVKRYEDSDAVKDALLDESLDLVWGTGVLTPAQLVELDAADSHLSVYHSDDIQNVIILLNTGKPPLDDVALRKTIIHAIDKKKIIDDNLGGLYKPVDNVFPRDAPFSDVDIFPRWDYDPEKARFLNCPDPAVAGAQAALQEKEQAIEELNVLVDQAKSQAEEEAKKNEEMVSELSGAREDAAEAEQQLETAQEEVARVEQEKKDEVDKLNALVDQAKSDAEKQAEKNKELQEEIDSLEEMTESFSAASGKSLTLGLGVVLGLFVVM